DHPEQVASMLRDWKAYAQRSNIAIDADGHPASPAKPATPTVASKP
ncbi:TPA: hypothetical protein QEM89_006016, partial [Pseudomonas putida]|nr:hypothetical protein [Pseudomonas putida]